MKSQLLDALFLNLLHSIFVSLFILPISSYDDKPFLYIHTYTIKKSILVYVSYWICELLFNSLAKQGV